MLLKSIQIRHTLTMTMTHLHLQGLKMITTTTKTLLAPRSNLLLMNKLIAQTFHPLTIMTLGKTYKPIDTQMRAMILLIPFLNQMTTISPQTTITAILQTHPVPPTHLTTISQSVAHCDTDRTKYTFTLIEAITLVTLIIS